MLRLKCRTQVRKSGAGEVIGIDPVDVDAVDDFLRLGLVGGAGDQVDLFPGLYQGCGQVVDVLGEAAHAAGGKLPGKHQNSHRPHLLVKK